jgi:hypothetical protein
LEITSKDNFKAEWFPAGWGEYGRHAQTREDTDWLSWSRETSRSPGYFTRPSNELFFIHGVRPATYSVKTRERVTNRPSFQLDQVFLAACKGVVEKLKKRRQGCFDVRMLTDVFIEWESDRDRDSTWSHKPARMIGWEIDDPRKRQAMAERATIEKMKEHLGFSADELIDAWTQASAGQPPVAARPPDLSPQVAKLLRERGFKVTKREVEPAMALLRKHEEAKLRAARVR